LQTAFAAFLNAILPEETLVGAVNGKAAKQMKDENGDSLLMLNVFAQTVKLHLASWTVLTNIALSLTRLLWQDERTLREVHEKCLTDPRLVAKRIGLKNKTC